MNLVSWTMMLWRAPFDYVADADLFFSQSTTTSTRLQSEMINPTLILANRLISNGICTTTITLRTGKAKELEITQEAF